MHRSSPITTSICAMFDAALSASTMTIWLCAAGGFVMVESAGPLSAFPIREKQ